MKAGRKKAAMPERSKIRGQISERLSGGGSYTAGRCNGDAQSYVIRSTMLADELYQIVCRTDFQRAIAIAKATHAQDCRDEKHRHDDDEICGHCLRAAMLSLEPTNMGLPIEDDSDDQARMKMTLEEELAREAHGWPSFPPIHPRDPEQHWRKHMNRAMHGGDLELGSGGIAEELALWRIAQRSGAAMLVGGREHPYAAVACRAGMRRDEIIAGLQAGIKAAQATIDRLSEDTGGIGTEPVIARSTDRR